MDYKEFFLTNNKSGWKTRESILKNREPEIYNKILSFTNTNSLNNLSFKEQVWCFINNETTRKKCLNCGDNTTFKETLAKGYNDFCSLKCANASGLLNDRVVKSNLEKHGVEYYSMHENFVSKVKATKLKRYGSENYNNITKSLETKEEKYGDKNYTNKTKAILTNRKNLLDKFDTMTSDKVVKYGLNDSNITLSCSTCNNNYEIYSGLFKYRTSVKVKPCTICNPIKDTNSIQEKELFKFIKEILPNEVILEKDRKIIPPFELDIFIPSHNIAIEFNGLHWHSEEYVDKNYHLNKTKLCEKQGIRVIHIFEDEWRDKQDILKSMFKNIFGVTENKIHGRKTEVKEVDSEEVKLFLNDNHVQGYVSSTIKLGLYYNDKLVSVMCFTKRKDIFELVRFCTELNTTVNGGASKLINYFIKNYSPKEIISFSEKRWNVGNLYSRVGFKFVYDTLPSYWYVFKHKRYHKFNFRKNKLKNDGYDILNKTEHQIMLERGIYRIYDCGLKKWSIKFI